jgi:hypothetical protein
MYEQLSRLTPFSQQAAPGLSWRTEIRISKSETNFKYQMSK